MYQSKQQDPSLDSSGFVLLGDRIPDAILEMRYYSTYNFIGERIHGYEEPVALCTREAAAALQGVSQEMLSLGYRLKIYDAYRPQTAVDHFVAWAENTQDTRMKEYFYQKQEKAKLFENGFIAKRSGHSRGSTIDLTLFDMRTGKDVDMGSTFDLFDDISWSEYAGELTTVQRQNRVLLRSVMIRFGFLPLESEWWHFTLKDEPYPDTYFRFPVRSSVISHT